MPYLYLAIFTQVIATTALKASDGFSKTLPSLIVMAGEGIAFYCLSLRLKTMDVGFVYAIWCGVGIVLVNAAAAVYDTHPVLILRVFIRAPSVSECHESTVDRGTRLRLVI